MKERTPSETRGEALRAAFAAAMEGIDGSFEEREATAMRLANEAVRSWLGAELGRMARTYGDEILVDGQRYRRHLDGTKSYHSLCGELTVTRATYRLVGVHNGPTVVPLELEAGIFANATPKLASSVLLGFAERPLRHYEAEMESAHRVVPSRSTLERIGKRIGCEMKRSLPMIEPVIRAFEAVPTQTHSISIGLDRTTVPMEEPAERTLHRRDKPYVRTAPAPVTVAYRMAYVGTIALNDREGNTIVSKRVTATPTENATELMNRLGLEILHVRAQRPELPLAVVQDGAPELWNLVDRWLDIHGLVATQVIDRFHVNERLAELCEAITSGIQEARALYQHWQTCLDRSDTAIDRICGQLNRLSDHHMLAIDDRNDPNPPSYWVSRSRPTIEGERASIAWGHLAYLERHRRYLRYATSVKRGIPIGSGVTEGACKSVVTVRFKRGGQRWRETGLSPCLHVRTLHLNGRLNACFDLLSHRRASRLRAY